MLIVFGGLPGTGKSSIACLLAKRLKATYVRIDTIEQALRQCGTLPHGVVTEGYTVGYAVAEDNLRGGGTVIADCVHPLTVTRDAWVAVARRAAVPILAVEVICSDIEEHRRRVETRVSDIVGLVLPSWGAIQRRSYQRWDGPHVILDTASQTAAASVEMLLDQLPSSA